MRLMTKDLRKKLPPLYDQDGKGEEAIAYARFFSPWSGWEWYATEFDGEDMFFGLVNGQYLELGYFRLSKLEGGRGIITVERDIHFTPKTIGKIKEEIKYRK